MDAVHRYEGTVSRLMGDGLMAMFGAPVAHEDHAVRACYAALAMLEAVRSTPRRPGRAHGVAIQIRVGLNSGEVIVRLISDDLHMDYTAMGQTVHLASRMEQLARARDEPPSRRDAGAGRGVRPGALARHGAGQGPGRPDRRSTSWSGPARRGRASRRLPHAGLTRFVGREAELATLYAGAGTGAGRPWPGRGAGRRAGRRQVAPGLRVHALASDAATGWCWRAARSPTARRRSWLPVIDLLKAYCRIEARDDARAVREKVTGKLLALDSALLAILPPLLSLLDLPVEDAAWADARPASAAPGRPSTPSGGSCCARARSSRCCWCSRTCTGSMQRPRRCSTAWWRRCRPPGSCCWSTTAPSTAHAWGNKSYYTQLRVDPLGGGRCRRAAGQPRRCRAPRFEPLKSLLIARTEGNPFFLEESVRRSGRDRKH